MKVFTETNLRLLLITLCVSAAVLESITLSYFILIQLGYVAFFSCMVALFHFSVMDSFNILWNNSRTGINIVMAWARNSSLLKRLSAFVAFQAILIGVGVFVCYYYCASYFNALLFLYTYLPFHSKYFPVILNMMLIPAALVAGMNILINALQLTQSLIMLVSDFGRIMDEEQFMDKKMAVKIFGYACALVLTLIFTEITYLSLSHGYQHYHLFVTKAPLSFLPLPLLLLSMTLAMGHTMRQIVNYTVDGLFYSQNASLTYWHEYKQKPFSERLRQAWAITTYVLRGYAKGVGTAMSLTRGFAPLFFYNALDKVVGDPVTSVSLMPTRSKMKHSDDQKSVDKDTINMQAVSKKIA